LAVEAAQKRAFAEMKAKLQEEDAKMALVRACILVTCSAFHMSPVNLDLPTLTTVNRRRKNCPASVRLKRSV
jgi:hypothetical protein